MGTWVFQQRIGCRCIYIVSTNQREKESDLCEWEGRKLKTVAEGIKASGDENEKLYRCVCYFLSLVVICEWVRRLKDHRPFISMFNNHHKLFIYFFHCHGLIGWSVSNWTTKMKTLYNAKIFALGSWPKRSLESTRSTKRDKSRRFNYFNQRFWQLRPYFSNESSNKI